MKIKNAALLGFLITSIFGMSSLAANGFFPERALWIQGVSGSKFIFGFNEKGSKSAGRAYSAGHYSIEVDGKLVGADKGIQIKGSGPESLVYKDNDDRLMRFRPGNQGVINFKVTRDYAHTAEFHDWFKIATDGKPQRREVVVTITGDDGQPQSQIHIFGCWPKSYRTSGHLVETLELVGESIVYTTK